MTSILILSSHLHPASEQFGSSGKAFVLQSEVTCSNRPVGWATCYFDLSFLGFLLAPYASARIMSQIRSRPLLFQVLSNSLFTDRPAIWSYWVCATDRIVKQTINKKHLGLKYGIISWDVPNAVWTYAHLLFPSWVINIVTYRPALGGDSANISRCTQQRRRCQDTWRVQPLLWSSRSLPVRGDVIHQ
jgi:hypothetical protein